MRSDLQQIISLPSIDAEYSFGRPKLYLAAKELARLTLLRSKLGDTRAERAAEPMRSVDATRHAARRRAESALLS